jgi:hypothetical protein
LLQNLDQGVPILLAHTKKLKAAYPRYEEIRFSNTTKWKNVQTLPKNLQSTPKKVHPTPEFVQPTPKIVQTPNRQPTTAANPSPNKKRKAPRKVTFPKTPNPAAHL